MTTLAGLRTVLDAAVVELPIDQLPALLGTLTEMAARTQLRLTSPPAAAVAVAGGDLVAAIFAEPMTDSMVAIYQECSRRTAAPVTAFARAMVVAGRGAGKG